MTQSMQIVTSFRQKYMFVLRASLYKKPKGLQPKRFMGEQITENFVRSIRSGTTAWRQLIGSHSSYRGWRRSHPHAAIELYITRALLSGDIHVYLMPDMAALNATKKQRQAHQANGKRIQFVPASYLLDNQAAQVQEIQTAQQADDVIAGCNFLPKQYSELAKALHLNNEPQALQKALQSGQVAIIKDDEPGKPQVWEIVEEVVNSAGMLGPHDGIEVNHVRQTPIISVAPQKVLVADKADMSLSVIATNSAYFIGGMTKFFGDTVTGTVEAIAANPADILYDTLLSVADVVTYPIDILITPFGYTTGAVARAHDRIKDVDNNLIAFGEEFSNNWAQGDWEALGSNVVAIPLAVSPRALVKPKVSGAFLEGALFDGGLYRSVPEGRNPLEIHPIFNTEKAMHRYTGEGQGGLYLGSSQRVVNSEFTGNGASIEGLVNNRYDVKIDGLLDLTNPSVRKGLGVELEDLIRIKGSKEWRYEITNPLGRYAEESGYNGIIAPATQADGGVNVILFNSGLVK